MVDARIGLSMLEGFASIVRQWPGEITDWKSWLKRRHRSSSMIVTSISVESEQRDLAKAMLFAIYKVAVRKRCLEQRACQNRRCFQLHKRTCRGHWFASVVQSRGGSTKKGL